MDYIRTLNFYTDGAYSSKTEMGGWGVLCVEDNELIATDSGYEPYTTNNRMELMAVLSVLNTLNTVETGHTKVIIYTDSSYIANCLNDKWYTKWLINGWQTSDRQDVKNQDLWRPLIAGYMKNKNRFSIEIKKVKSHTPKSQIEEFSPLYWNREVDALAVKKRKELE